MQPNTAGAPAAVDTPMAAAAAACQLQVIRSAEELKALVELLLGFVRMEHATLQGGRSPLVLPHDPVLLACLVHSRVLRSKAREAEAALAAARRAVELEDSGSSSSDEEGAEGSSEAAAGGLPMQGLQAAEQAVASAWQAVKESPGYAGGVEVGSAGAAASNAEVRPRFGSEA